MGIFGRDRRARRGRAWLALLPLAGALVAVPVQRAAAQGAVKSVHQDWQIRCDTPPGAKSEQCALIQSVTAEDRANVGLTVIVLKTADQKSRLMRVVAPLGVLLPSGLGLKIDNVDIGRAGFVRCLPNGCIAEVVMDDALIAKLRNGKTVRAAVQNGFDRVWITILDTHATALIAAAFLFQFGTGPIKGFAVTLVVGLVSNVFASYFVSKFIFEWVLGKRHVESLSI